MKPEIGIAEKHLHKSIDILSVLLADACFQRCNTLKIFINNLD